MTMKYKAIQTKILPPTQVLPTRIKVWAQDKKPVTYSKWIFGDYGNDKLHVQAAEKFREAIGWTEGQWATGELVPGHQVHVRVV
jgi:hypothetical protein